MNVKGVGQKLVQNLVDSKQENRSESTARRPVAPRSRRNSPKVVGAGVGGPAPANANANGMRASGKSAAKEAGPSVVRDNLIQLAQ